MKKLIITFILVAVSTCTLFSQNRTIKGRVISDDFEIVPFALIMINDTVEVGRTDANGFFQVDIPVFVKKILFRGVGFDQTSIDFINTCDEVEVVMMLSSTYDFRTLRKADKLRMKKYKQLPELHKEAFEKGIFKTDKACYTQEFVPQYNKTNGNINAAPIF